jgi:hypothetical protein
MLALLLFKIISSKEKSQQMLAFIIYTPSFVLGGSDSGLGLELDP